MLRTWLKGALALVFALTLFAPLSQESAADPPLLTLDGGTPKLTVSGGTVVWFSWSTGSEVAIWSNMDGATGCSGQTQAGWRTDYGGSSVWTAGVTLWYQSRWINDPDTTSPCVSATWVSAVTPTVPPVTPTETPITPTETPVAPSETSVDPGTPVLTLQGGTPNLVVPDYKFVYFSWSPNSEVAIWVSYEGKTGCSGTPSSGWSPYFAVNAIYTAGTTVWFQARWINDTGTTSECVSATWIDEATAPPTAPVTSTETPVTPTVPPVTPTETPVTPTVPAGAPYFTLDGGTPNLTVPGLTYVYFSWSPDSEVAIWVSTDGATGCSDTPSAGWTPYFSGNSVYTAGTTVWYQSRWINDPGTTSPCVSATWSDDATIAPTVTATATEMPETPTETPVTPTTPTGAPFLTLDGGTPNLIVPGYTYAHFSWSQGAEVAIWSSLDGATGSAGTTQAGWRTDYAGNSVWTAGVTLWYQARWISDPGVTSPCVSATWSDTASITPTATATEASGPLLIINGGSQNITLPSAQFVFLNWSAGAEVAVWNSLYGATGFSGTPETGQWRTDYAGNSVWIAGVTLWYQARWINDPGTTSPCLSVTWTNDPSSVTQTIIRVQIPAGVSLEGDRWSLYALITSQVPMGAYAEGTVGSDNTIVLKDIPAGDYRLEIYPEGADPLVLSVTIGSESEVLTLQPVDISATPTPTDGATETAKTVPTDAATGTVAAEPTSTSAAVSGLPATGSGAEQSNSATILTTMALLTGTIAVILVGSRKRADR